MRKIGAFSQNQVFNFPLLSSFDIDQNKSLAICLEKNMFDAFLLNQLLAIH